MYSFVVYLKSTSELNCVINNNQGTFDFINKSKVLLVLESGGLESGRLDFVMYLKSTSELNCIINKNQGTFDLINKSKIILGLESGSVACVASFLADLLQASCRLRPTGSVARAFLAGLLQQKAR